MNKIRKGIQFLSTILINLNIKGLFTGTLYGGKLKGICVPGLNCYSCPAALSSCPLGALQATLGNLKRGINWYIIGLLSLFSVVLGRFICGFLCPFGLLQELLFHIPTPKMKHLPKPLTYVKYGVLVIFVVAIPVGMMLMKGMGIPGFCKYICPQGTIAGVLMASVNSGIRSMIHGTFWWKIGVLISILIWSIVMYRPFCRVICPLGALYGLFNSIAFVQIHINQVSCTHCGKCSRACPVELDVISQCNSVECVRCGKCVDVCTEHAVKLGFNRKK